MIHPFLTIFLPRRIFALLACLLILLLPSACHHGAAKRDELFELQTQNVKPLPAVVQVIEKGRLVFIGETHTDMADHFNQLQIIQALHERKKDLAIGLEMFRAEAQTELDRWVAGETPPERFRRIYLDNWAFPWEFYGLILDYAREHSIPLVGLNVPRGITSQVARSGFSSLSPEQLRQLPEGVSCTLSPVYEDFIRKVHGDGAHGGRNFRNFCEAQMLWDSAMALYAMRHLDLHPGRILVVLAGGGHAWKHGIPAQLQPPEHYPSHVLLNETEELPRQKLSGDDADYLWLR